MLWLTLHFRQLPLEVFTRGAPSDTRLIAVNPSAESNAAIEIAIASGKVTPLWLLTTPKPLREHGETYATPHDHDRALSLLAGPERIDADWWDGQHVARNTALSLLWVYRERNPTAQWCVHGFFVTLSPKARP